METPELQRSRSLSARVHGRPGWARTTSGQLVADMLRCSPGLRRWDFERTVVASMPLWGRCSMGWCEFGRTGSFAAQYDGWSTRNSRDDR